MSTTSPREIPAQPARQPNKELRRDRLVFAAAAYAAVEIAVAILAGGFFEIGRAEPLLFVAFRPWLLIGAASLVASYGLRERINFYLLALLLAVAAETLLLVGLGARELWVPTLRGLAAGALLLVPVDAGLQLARRLAPRWGRPALTAVLAILFLTPLGSLPYERVALAREREPVAKRPPLMLMTGLPIIWGEGGAFDPESRPAAAYRMLEREFAVRPLDVIDRQSLGKGGVLLVAQSRALAPQELVALDAWVRGGGRALILEDPALVWPTELPLGDVRRPPAAGLLGPVLTHWGIEVEPPAETKLVIRDVGGRRIAFGATGRVGTRNPACRVEEEGLLARCRIGAGQVILLADADLLQDRLWTAPGRSGERRNRRLSDNPLLVADLLDELRGDTRGRVAGDVEWIGQARDRRAALVLAALPLLIALLTAFLIRRRRA
ncbi:MAG TPA: hypothetical protein VNT25_01070 [Allosphingosinicella sp.]|nr:hypothetical protein [Allosphingosinicella sp.]